MHFCVVSAAAPYLYHIYDPVIIRDSVYWWQFVSLRGREIVSQSNPVNGHWQSPTLGLDNGIDLWARKGNFICLWQHWNCWYVLPLLRIGTKVQVAKPEEWVIIPVFLHLSTGKFNLCQLRCSNQLLACHYNADLYREMWWFQMCKFKHNLV